MLCASQRLSKKQCIDEPHSGALTSLSVSQMAAAAASFKEAHTLFLTCKTTNPLSLVHFEMFSRSWVPGRLGAV